METKHTKGEWSVDGLNTTSVITNINGYTKVCDCHLAGITGNDALQFLEENKANAKLIASAPDLLEALISLMNDIRPTTYPNRKWEDEMMNQNGEKIGSISMPQDESLIKALNAIKKATS